MRQFLADLMTGPNPGAQSIGEYSSHGAGIPTLQEPTSVVYCSGSTIKLNQCLITCHREILHDCSGVEPWRRVGLYC